jgi:DNA-binding NarL/FixJ family response regulator
MEKSNWLQPHLVILDLSMPELDGLSAARELQRRSPGLPVVMITVDKSDFLQVLARQAGILAVFSKMECSYLKDFVRHLLEPKDEILPAVAAKDDPQSDVPASTVRSPHRPVHHLLHNLP